MQNLINLNAAIDSSSVLFERKGDTSVKMTINFSVPSIPFTRPLDDDSKTVVEDGDLMFSSVSATATNTQTETQFQIKGLISSKRPRTGGGVLKMIDDLLKMVHDEPTRNHIKKIAESISLL